MRHSEIVSGARRFSQEHLAEYFLDPQLYKKVGVTKARLAQQGERIETVVDGKVETTNTANAEDVVLKGPKGEEYIISGDKFRARYAGPSLTDEFQSYHPTGTTYAVEWSNGPARFKASWGEMMIIEDGDFLCSPTEVPQGDLYRVEGEVFDQTYELVGKKAA
jgi:hypothetical protein